MKIYSYTIHTTHGAAISYRFTAYQVHESFYRQLSSISGKEKIGSEMEHNIVLVAQHHTLFGSWGGESSKRFTQEIYNNTTMSTLRY